MKKFKFKLEKVLKYRILLEDIAKTEYQKSLSDLRAKVNKLKLLESKKKEISEKSVIKKGSYLDSQTFEFITVYIKQLLFLIDIQKEIILKQQEITEKNFKEWVIKKKETKVIKKLKEKRLKEYIDMSGKEEQKFLDEIFIAKMVNKIQHSGSME